MAEMESKIELLQYLENKSERWGLDVSGSDCYPLVIAILTCFKGTSRALSGVCLPLVMNPLGRLNIMTDQSLSRLLM